MYLIRLIVKELEGDMKKVVIFLSMIYLLSSCYNDSKGDDQIIVHHHDNFKNGKKSIDSLKELSIKEGRAGNFLKLKALAEKVYKIDSSDADNLSRLSTVYLTEGNHAKGLLFVNQSIKLDTGRKLPFNSTIKACLFYELKLFDSSEVYFQRMLKNNPNNAIDLCIIGETFNLFKKYDKAIEYNEIAYKYYPNDVKVNFFRANILSYQKKYVEALQVYNKIEKYSVNNPEFYFSRGACYMYLGEYEKAMKDVSNSIKIKGKSDIRDITAMARINQKMGNYKEAEKNYKISIESGDTMAVRLYKSLLKEMEN